MTTIATADQPRPDGDGDVVLFQVIEDFLARARLGRRRYGTYLRAHNGRLSLTDAYHESIDLVMYLGQATVEEQDRRAAIKKLLDAIGAWIEADCDSKFSGALIRTYQDTRQTISGAATDDT